MRSRINTFQEQQGNKTNKGDINIVVRVIIKIYWSFLVINRLSQ